MVRRNMVPGPKPSPLAVGYSQVSAGGVEADSFSVGDNLIYYSGFPVDASNENSSLGGWIFANYLALPIIPGERYSFTVSRTYVYNRPATGFVRFVWHWIDEDGTFFASEFGENLQDSVEYLNQNLYMIAPEGAKWAAYSLTWQPNLNDAPISSYIEMEAGGFIVEPLGPVPPVSPIAIENLITAPTLKYETSGNKHVADGYPDGSGWVEHIGGPTGSPVWEVSEEWSVDPGGKSRYHEVVSGTTIIPGVVYSGFIGSYILPKGVPGHYVTPGETLTFTIDVNVLAAGAFPDPGCWLEMVWYFYDGDPVHTRTVRHDNSDHLFTPGAVALGERTLSMTKVAPLDYVDIPGVGLRQANIMQLVCALATTRPSTLLKFYSDHAILTRTDSPIPYFDGDSEPEVYINPSWTGFPGKSTSLTVGNSPKLPGPYFDGDTEGFQWEGASGNSVSSEKVPDGFRSKVFHSPGINAVRIFDSIKP